MLAGALPFLAKSIAQIALIVPNLEEAVEAYVRLFGIGPWHFYTYGKPLLNKMTYQGRPVEYSMRLALAYVGALRLELIELGEGETVYADFVREHGYGVHHIGVLVEDMTEALHRAKAAGLRVTQEGAGFGADGDGYYAYLDTEPLLGVTVELIQRPLRRTAPEKTYPPEEGAEKSAAS